MKDILKFTPEQLSEKALEVISGDDDLRK